MFIFLVCLDSFYLATNFIRIRKEVYYTNKISEEFNGMKVVFFSDTHLNKFFNEKRLKQLVDKINKIDADIVLFGGDLFDHPGSNNVSEETKNMVISYFSKIEAKLNKYAVYGNHDLENSNVKELYNQIMKSSGFEILNNENVKIHNKKNSYFNLIGIDSMLLGSPNINSAYELIQDKDFNLVFCHTPDIVEKVNPNKTDLFLAGHSHGGQINFIFPIYKPYGAEKYYKGIYKIYDIILDVSNGVGTTRYDIRFNAPSEIVVYTIERK